MPDKNTITIVQVNNTNKTEKVKESTSVKLPPYTTLMSYNLTNGGKVHFKTAGKCRYITDLDSYNPNQNLLFNRYHLLNSNEVIIIWYNHIGEGCRVPNEYVDYFKSTLSTNGKPDFVKIREFFYELEYLTNDSIEIVDDTPRKYVDKKRVKGFNQTEYLYNKFENCKRFQKAVASGDEDPTDSLRALMSQIKYSLYFISGGRIDYVTYKITTVKGAFEGFIKKDKRYKTLKYVPDWEMYNLAMSQLKFVKNLPHNSLKRKFSVEKMKFRDEIEESNNE